jgi:hypothetical protein
MTNVFHIVEPAEGFVGHHLQSSFIKVLLEEVSSD